MLKPSNRRKYLCSYAEPEATIEPPTGKQYSAAIVVPACGETHAFLDRWQTTLRPHESRPALVVLVVNGDEHTPLKYARANEQLVAAVLSRCAVRKNSVGPSYLVTYDGFDVLLIARAQVPHLLPAKCGVGLARKIGGDVVCAWHAQGAVISPWWMSTDADVELPYDIVQQLCRLPKQPGTACLPFEHVASNDARLNAATYAVEVELRYHALGLEYAGSHYAWPALGSCLAVHVDTYATVRGFPKRQAGEDHYLLQKATKVAPVLFPAGEPVRIRARRSERTPFGTGRSVEDLLKDDVVALKLRHPQCYMWLARVLSRLEALGSSGDWVAFRHWLTHESPSVPPVASALEHIGAVGAWQHTCELNLSPHARARRLHEWFDGLRQIQFLRSLEPLLPRLPFDEALQVAPFTPGVFAASGRTATSAESMLFKAAKSLAALQAAARVPAERIRDLTLP